MTQRRDNSKPTSTIEQLQEMRLARRREAAEQYRELLLRNDNPRAGDADALVGIMQTLGRTPDDLPGDVTLVRAVAALEDAERQAQKLDGPWERARQTMKETEARIQQEREEFEKRVNAELEAAASAFRKLTAQRHSLHQASEQAPRDEWTAIIEGISVEEARAARRMKRRSVAAKPAAPSREEVIGRCRKEVVLHRLVPVGVGVVDGVNAELAALHLDPLTPDEIQKYGIETWIEPGCRPI